MKRAKNIVLYVICINGLALTSGRLSARPIPQSQGQETDAASNQRNMEPDGAENGKESRSYVRPKDTSSHRHDYLKLGKYFLEDQNQIWSSPAKLRLADSVWLAPLGGLTAGLLVTDRDFSRHSSASPAKISRYNNLSNAGLAGFVGGAGSMWLLGHVKHKEHWTETGFLAGEAAFNSLFVVESMKYSLRRERPLDGDGSGPFFRSGGTSFPSEHAATAWAVAGVIAHEYPGPLTKIAAYGLASLIDISRLKAHQHFPSDVVVGSLIGNLVAQNIYSRRHDPELGGETWRSISQIVHGDGSYSPANQGSAYVLLDSWIYPVLDRLSAMGLIDSGFAGLRPWTRRECERLLGEAEEQATATPGNSAEAQGLLQMLRNEFHPEAEADENHDARPAFRLESVYSRTEHISGTPLTDGYDFAQTQFNDFGRPSGEGWNTVNGFSTYATSGPWVLYMRGEVQTAPSIPALPLSARQVIAAADLLPLQPATQQPAVMQATLLDTYVGLTFSNWEISFGRQSLWWGTSPGTSLELSNNAQPIDMLRITRTSPLKLPGILHWLGPMRTEFFLGRLAGYEFIFSPLGLVGQWGQGLANQPFMHGQYIGFKPTRNFEFGFYRTTIFAGEGYHFTAHTLVASLFDTGNTVAGQPNKPGKRTSGLDLNYRLPGLRNWVTLYADGLTYDEFSPIAYPTWSAWHSGLYFSHFPKVSKLDLRVEGVYTDVPKWGGTNQPGTFYFNDTWRSGYTNNGNIMGSWIGRGGQGAQAWTNYWFRPRNRLQFNFRHEKVSQVFIPGGGTLTDFGMRADYWIRSRVGITASVQYERWLFPVIQPNIARNVAASLEIQLQPQKVFGPLFSRRAGEAANPGDAN